MSARAYFTVVITTHGKSWFNHDIITPFVQTFVPKKLLGLGFGFGFNNFWVLGLGFGFGYNNFWVLGLGFGYNTTLNTQTQSPIFSG
jgi:hypothetical protein